MWLSKLFKKKAPAKPAKTEKELATEMGLPYIKLLNMDIDNSTFSSGSFEFDWNDKFIADCIRAGYQGKTDSDIVDQWFQNICRNVVLETYEQQVANDKSANTPVTGSGHYYRSVE